MEKDGDPIKALLECLFNGDDKASSGPTMALGALKPTRDRLDFAVNFEMVPLAPLRPGSTVGPPVLTSWALPTSKMTPN